MSQLNLSPFVVSLSNHEQPFDKLRANGLGLVEATWMKGSR